MKLRRCILIHLLPLAYLEDAVKSMSELTAISEKSISLMKCDHWGGKFILDNKKNFRRVLSLSTLNIHGKEYSLYSMITDVIICGIGAPINAQKVEFLLERYAPVLLVYEKKSQEGVITFRAALNCPEIPEITRLWTELKISGYNDIEFSISPYCRFCGENGHFKSQCQRRKIPVAKDVTSGFPSLPICKVTDKQITAVTASDYSTRFSNFAKGSSDIYIEFADLTKESSDNNIEFVKFVKENSDIKIEFADLTKESSDSNIEFTDLTKESSDSNIEYTDLTKESSDSNMELVKFVKRSSDNNTGFADFAKEDSDRNTRFENFDMGSPDSSAVCRRDSDTDSATSSNPSLPSANLEDLIPPLLKNDIEALKLFFSHCKTFKNMYKSALCYPAGIGILLKQLRKIVKFNKNIKTKSEEEAKFIAWICLLLSKLEYSHLKKSIQLEPSYVPPL